MLNPFLVSVALGLCLITNADAALKKKRKPASAPKVEVTPTPVVSVDQAAPPSTRFWDRVFVGAGLGLGYRDLASTNVDNVSKQGYFANGRVFGEYRFERWGAVGLALGDQETFVRGTKDSNYQSILSNTLMVDLYYLYPVWKKTLWVGPIFSQELAKGARLDMTDLTSYQVLGNVGVHARWHFKMKSWDWVAGLEVLYGYNSPSKSIWTIPAYFGIIIPLGNKEIQPADAAQPAPVPVPTAGASQ